MKRIPIPSYIGMAFQEGESCSARRSDSESRYFQGQTHPEGGIKSFFTKWP